MQHPRYSSRFHFFFDCLITMRLNINIKLLKCWIRFHFFFENVWNFMEQKNKRKKNSYCSSRFHFFRDFLMTMKLDFTNKFLKCSVRFHFFFSNFCNFNEQKNYFKKIQNVRPGFSFYTSF
jgi:hypothetical protein